MAKRLTSDAEILARGDAKNLHHTQVDRYQRLAAERARMGESPAGIGTTGGNPKVTPAPAAAPAPAPRNTLANAAAQFKAVQMRNARLAEAEQALAQHHQEAKLDAARRSPNMGFRSAPQPLIAPEGNRIASSINPTPPSGTPTKPLPSVKIPAQPSVLMQAADPAAATLRQKLNAPVTLARAKEWGKTAGGVAGKGLGALGVAEGAYKATTGKVFGGGDDQQEAGWGGRLGGVATGLGSALTMVPHGGARLAGMALMAGGAGLRTLDGAGPTAADGIVTPEAIDAERVKTAAAIAQREAQQPREPLTVGPPGLEDQIARRAADVEEQRGNISGLRGRLKDATLAAQAAPTNLPVNTTNDFTNASNILRNGNAASQATRGEEANLRAALKDFHETRATHAHDDAQAIAVGGLQAKQRELQYNMLEKAADREAKRKPNTMLGPDGKSMIEDVAMNEGLHNINARTGAVTILDPNEQSGVIAQNNIGNRAAINAGRADDRVLNTGGRLTLANSQRQQGRGAGLTDWSPLPGRNGVTLGDVMRSTPVYDVQGRGGSVPMAVSALSGGTTDQAIASHVAGLAGGTIDPATGKVRKVATLGGR
jgi:predicted nucleic acid-binding protein